MLSANVGSGGLDKPASFPRMRILENGILENVILENVIPEVLTPEDVIPENVV